MELTPKNLYDYLSKHNVNQRKIEKLLEVFGVDLSALQDLLEGGMLLGIFTYDKEDGWNTESFSNIDSKKFFDFVYAGLVPAPSTRPTRRKDVNAEPESEAKVDAGNEEDSANDTHVHEKYKKNDAIGLDTETSGAATDGEGKKNKNATKKPAPKAIVKSTLKPIQAQEPEEPKPFVLRGLYKLLLRNNDQGTDIKTMMNHYIIDENDLEFVLAYLESKRIFTKDTQMRWYAAEEMAADPLLKKTLIGLRNMAILNKEFKNKAMRSSR